MAKKIYDGDFRRITLNEKMAGLRIDAIGVWPDDGERESEYSPDVLDSLTGEEAAAILERPEGWTPGQPYVRFPCTLEELRRALGTYADAIDEDVAAEYAGAGAPASTATSGEPDKPLSKQRFQEQEVLRVLRELGRDPRALPKRANGKRWVKADVREKLKWTESIFDKAWDRLVKDGEIKEA